MPTRNRRRRLGLLALLVAVATAWVGPTTHAETFKPHIPVFFDPDRRVPKPDLSTVKSIRFLTTDDFPPFHFALPNGTLAGFDIDLARIICSDLKLACTVQIRRFDTLIPQIKGGKDDALIAAVANTSATRADLSFTAPYYTTPARFVSKTKTGLKNMTPEGLAGHKVGVEASTAHEAYLRTFFPKSTLKSYPDRVALRGALQKGEVEAIFGDAIALSQWLNSDDARECCAFQGGPFTESRFFGNGVSIAVAKNNRALRQVLDFELAELTKNGTYADLYLKYFPIGIY